MIPYRQTGVKTSEVAKYFGLDPASVSRTCRSGRRYDLVYLMFNDKRFTDEEKFKYLRGVSLPDATKDKLWAKYLAKKELIQ